MSEEQVNPEDEAPAEKAAQPGKAGRKFVSFVVLALAAVTAGAAYLRNGEFIQNLLTKDESMSRLIANLHPIFMLLPIGLILMVLLSEIFGWLSFGKWKPMNVFALCLAVITAILAALSGVVMMLLDGNSGDSWTQYLWYGVGAAAALSVAFVLKIWGRNGNGHGFFYAIFLLGAAGLLGYGGVHYGKKVHSYSLVPSEENSGTPFGWKKEMTKMGSDISELESAGEEMKSDLSEKEQKIAETSKSLETMKQAYQGEQKKRAKVETDAAALKAKVDESAKQIKQKDAQAMKLQNELNKAKQDLAGLKKRFDAEVAQKTKQQGENAKLKGELQKQKTAFDQLKAAADKQKAAAEKAKQQKPAEKQKEAPKKTEGSDEKPKPAPGA